MRIDEWLGRHFAKVHLARGIALSMLAQGDRCTVQLGQSLVVLVVMMGLLLDRSGLNKVLGHRMWFVLAMTWCPIVLQERLQLQVMIIIVVLLVPLAESATLHVSFDDCLEFGGSLMSIRRETPIGDLENVDIGKGLLVACRVVECDLSTGTVALLLPSIGCVSDRTRVTHLWLGDKVTLFIGPHDHREGPTFDIKTCDYLARHQTMWLLLMVRVRVRGGRRLETILAEPIVIASSFSSFLVEGCVHGGSQYLSCLVTRHRGKAHLGLVRRCSSHPKIQSLHWMQRWALILSLGFFLHRATLNHPELYPTETALTVILCLSVDVLDTVDHGAASTFHSVGG